MNNRNREKLLNIIGQRDDNPQTNQRQTPRDYISLVEAHMKENGSTKAMAMRAITAKHPGAHEVWLKSQQLS